MSIPATNNVARYITAWPSSADPQKLVMQFENPNEMKKTAVIQMTNGVYKGKSAVYAFQSIHTWDGNDNIQRFAVNAGTGAVTASNSGGSSSATSNDPPEYQAHGLIVLPPCVKKTPTKVWAGKTLDDIKAAGIQPLEELYIENNPVYEPEQVMQFAGRQYPVKLAEDEIFVLPPQFAYFSQNKP